MLKGTPTLPTLPTCLACCIKHSNRRRCFAIRINIIAEPFFRLPFPLHDDIRAVWKGFGKYSREKGLIPVQLAASSAQMLRTKAHSLVCQLEGREDCLREGRPPHLGWRTGFSPSLKAFLVFSPLHSLTGIIIFPRGKK